MDRIDHADPSLGTNATTAKSSSRTSIYVAFVLAIVLVGAYLISEGIIELPFNQGQSSAAAAGLRVGTVAPDFALKDLQGNEIRLSDYRGKVVLLNFWATWCPPCRIEMPFIEAVYREQADNGFVVIAVSIDEDPNAVVQFSKEYGLTFPVVIDTPQQRVANLYRLYPIPTTFFIDKDGVIRDAHVGAMDKKLIMKKLSKLM